VLPGDDVTNRVVAQRLQQEQGAAATTTTATAVPKIGTGLRYDGQKNRVYATVAGRLERHRNRNAYYVAENLRRYRPALEDRVVGIVEDRAGSDGAGGDVYRVNIGASHPASLSNLSFEGATKRNKPSFYPGQLLYARISELPGAGSLDPVLSCQLGPHDGGIPRKDWMTNEGCYGELRGGTACRISTGLARGLLRPDNLVLAELANAKIAFEVAVGVNGFLWIHSQLPHYTVMILNAIKNSEVLTPGQVRSMVKNLSYTVEKQLQRDRDAMEE